MKLITTLLIIFLAITLCSCSQGTVTEDYTLTPAKAMSIGEGRRTFTLNYQGKSLVLVKGSDGKYYALPDPSADPLESAMQRMDKVLKGK